MSERRERLSAGIAPGAVGRDGTQRAGLLQIAEMCPAHRTLAGKIEIRTTLADA
jgi:hypothetical protein